MRGIVLAAVVLAGCVGVSPPALRKAGDTRVPDSPSLKTALKRRDPEVRALAARQMGRIQSPAYEDDLLRALREDASSRVRTEAAFALGQLRIDETQAPSPALAQGLVNALADPHPDVRAAAAEALGKAGGPEAEDRLRALLAERDPALRREAAAGLFRLRYLKRIPDYATATVKALSASFADRDAESRWRAVYAFSRWPEPRAASALAAAVADKDPFVRLFALRSLGQLKKDAPADRIASALSDSDEKVRAEAAAALKAAGRAELLTPKAAADTSHHVRAAVAAALENPEGDLELLRPLAKDLSPMARAQAVQSLAKRLGDAYADELLGHATDRSWWVRSRAYLAASDLPNRGERIAEHGLRDKDVRVQAAALESVAKRPGKEAEVILAGALADPKSKLELRGTAVDAAGQRKSADLIAPLRKALGNSTGREWIELRESLVDAAAAIAETHPKHAGLLELRRQLLNDPAPSVRAKAAKSLGLPPAPAPRPEPSPLLEQAPPPATQVIFETDKGNIVLELAPGEAPVHAAGFVSNARSGVYNGTPWHRVVSNFVVQGADPRGSGWGDCGYSVRDEINRLRFERGTVGMPKAGKDTGGCQVFITHIPTPHLDGRYTVFGRVVSGMEVVDRLSPGDLIRSTRVR